MRVSLRHCKSPAAVAVGGEGDCFLSLGEVTKLAEFSQFTSRLPDREKKFNKNRMIPGMILIKMENQGKRTKRYLNLTSDSFTAGSSLSALFSLKKLLYERL